MNKVIELQKDLPLKSILARAKKEANSMVLIEGIKHTIYFQAPTVNDLVIIELKDDKWNIRKCKDKEWHDYYYNFIYNKEKFNKNK